ncbi:hypothetical protein RSAG8_11553, partial [Rhizoctonia solani AG-8 WAC10335]
MKYIAMTIAALFAVSVYASPAPQTTDAPFPGECNSVGENCTWLISNCCKGLVCRGSYITHDLGYCVTSPE